MSRPSRDFPPELTDDPTAIGQPRNLSRTDRGDAGGQSFVSAASNTLPAGVRPNGDAATDGQQILETLDECPPPRDGIFSKFIGVFRPAEDVSRISDHDEMKATYRYWRRQVLLTSMVGYALFYFLRKNLSVAMPAMEADLGISKSDLGLFLTLHGLLYGVSKFFNGFLGDRANARYFMALGLLLTAIVNVFFGFSTAVVTLGLFWLLNGYCQGMGFPPCARVITHWFGPGERATIFSVWNTSHSIGAAGVLVLTSFLVKYDWRLCFYVPAAIGVVGAIFLLRYLRDTPGSLGLPEVEQYTGERSVHTAEPTEPSSPESFHRFLRRRVFSNPLVWTVALANFFVYAVRYAILDWGPSYLNGAKGVELGNAGLMVACFEIGGIVGMLVGGVVTDRLFNSCAGRACVVYMALCAALVYCLWKVPIDSLWINTALLAGIGFFIYGPQCLVGVLAANLATKRAAATAIGLTGLFGYASTVLSGWGLGSIVENYSWHTGFQVIVACAVAATVLFLLLWNVGANTELESNAE